MSQEMIDLLNGKIAQVAQNLRGLMLMVPTPERERLMEDINTLQYVMQEIHDSNPNNIIINGY